MQLAKCVFEQLLLSLHLLHWQMALFQLAIPSPSLAF
jgi:hypothetical protein